MSFDLPAQPWIPVVIRGNGAEVSAREALPPRSMHIDLEHESLRT